MPFNAAEIALVGQTTLDFHQRNKPVDQYNHKRPLLDCLEKKKSTFPASKEFISESLRTGNDSNFQYNKGSGIVTYNHKNIFNSAQFPWTGIHDGFFLSEDELSANGIIVNDKVKGKYTAAEKERLINILVEHKDALDEGFREKFDFNLHLDGVAGVDAIAGLDHLIALNPAVGVVGGIDRALVPYWRNQAALGLTAANIRQVMEQLWRLNIRNGGQPDKIICGSAFLDTYRAAINASGVINVQAGSTTKVEGAYGETTFHGVELVWDPTFDDLDAALLPVTPWANRCYFINTRHIKLRPMEGQDMVTRTPTRPHDQYVQYWAKTWKGGLTMNRANAHSVLSVA